ncbi:MAG: hypothetical protein GF411_18860 [Candidatus Lokiarchaeota archaeon]|nr:hypothetical protein [Candidatus Lokiarchaeota archaeon]
MVDFIKERISNLIEFVTSKKVIVGALAAAFIIYAADLAKIIAIGVIAVAYIVAQGFIDIQKMKAKQDKPVQPKQ